MSLPSFINMPMPLKIGVILAGGGGLMSVAYFINPRLLWVVFIGLVMLALLLLAYRALLKKLRKRKAKSMEGEIDGTSGARPQGIKKAEDLARLEDLRKKFENGIQTFRTSGKDLYSLPWYMFVGEPGSGKTEAIRHCNVGFPPGLQDAYQGVGGTVNMNWWFTDHAVILDTAGRLMFEDVLAGASSEWKEFLKLLKNNRPNCPINGMFLVIPADSLIKDTADEIEKKASQIAQQFDMIQRTLDVRFPVFVVVAKSDLINGFREFFENLDDPKLQHQIMGWSNPAPLDEPFNPDLIDQHLITIQKRLCRRRLGLLQDPTPKNSQLRRIEELDALYDFPQSLAKISPRLQRYLELIFSVGSQWSGKPLFLRGIYFTSSLREGSALDADLAEALGVPVESLPEGRVWEQDRAYFLRDLFMEKVFKERGLVTNATNAKKQHTRRRMSVTLAGLAGAVLLLFFTWLGGNSLKKSIGVHRNVWLTAAYKSNWADGLAGHKYWKPIVYPEYLGSTKYEYGGNASVQFPDEGIAEIKVDGEPINTCQFHDQINKSVRKAIHVPWIFRLTATLGSDINRQRQKAQRVLFEHSVLWPLLDYTREKMKSQESTPWSDVSLAPGALVQLLRTEALAYEGRSFNETEKFQSLDALAGYVLYRSEEPDKYEKNYQKWTQHSDLLQNILNSVYANLEKDEFASLSGGSTLEQNEPIDKGVKCFVNSYGTGQTDKSHLGKTLSLVEKLVTFRSLEEEIIKLGRALTRDSENLTTYSQIEQGENAWDALLQQLVKVKTQIDAATKDVLGNATLAQAYSDAVKSAIVQIGTDYEPLLNEIRPRETEKSGLLDSAMKQIDSDLQPAIEDIPIPQTSEPENILGQIQYQLGKARKEREKEIGKLAAKDKQLLDELHADFLTIGKDQRYFYEDRYYAYSGANDQLKADDPLRPMSELPESVKKIESDIESVRSQIGKVLDVDHKLYGGASDVSKIILQLARQKRMHNLLKNVLSNKAPTTVEQIELLVEDKAKDLAPIRRPRIDMTAMQSGEFETRYHPQAAKAVMGGWEILQNCLLDRQADPADKKLELVGRDELLSMYQRSQSAFNEYASDYFIYWTETVFDDRKITGNSWDEFYKNIANLRVTRTCSGLLDLYEKLDKALIPEIKNALEKDKHDEFDKARAAVQISMDSLGKTSSKRIWSDIIDNWIMLGEDPAPLQKLLTDKSKMSLPGFMDKYFPFFEDEDEINVDKYWADTSHHALELLVKDFIRTKAENSQILEQQYSRFPLARPQAAGKELTMKEIDEVRDVLKKVVIPPFEKTNIKQVNSLLEKLQEIDPEKNLWLTKLNGVMDALPQKYPFSCRVLILGAQEQQRLLKAQGHEYEKDRVALIWRVMALAQGDTQKGKIRTDQADNELLGEIKYPGERIALRFYTHSDSQAPDCELTLDSLWACIGLLHGGQLRDVKGNPKWHAGERLEEGKKWNVEIVFQDDLGKDRSIWIQLEFEYGLPAISEWPDVSN